MKLTFVPGALTALLIAGLTAGVQSASSTEVVLDGLSNPRGLAFAPDGSLYLVEAGSGAERDHGRGPGGSDTCMAGPTGPRCSGFSGSVLRVNLNSGRSRVVVSKLPSMGVPGTGDSATGAHDIAFDDDGTAYFTIGWGGDPALRTNQPLGREGRNFGRLAELDKKGNVELLSDLARFEGRFDPNEDGPDSNPYGIKISGNRRIVADAGANALLEILDDGDITTLATFPSTGWQAVPTGVAVDNDGNYYVGQLTGFPFPAGQANVYRVPRNGGTPEVFAAGFSNIIDLEFGPDGSLWVLQIGSPITGFANRALIKVSADGQTKTPVDVPLLSAPGGLAVARNGDVYVTNKSVSATEGELLRIRP